MTINYISDNGIILLGKELKWGAARSYIRDFLPSGYFENDTLIDMSSYFGGDSAFNIQQRRDIYRSLGGEPCLIFLNYDENDLLRDIEVHGGATIETKGVLLPFSKNIDTAENELKTVSGNMKVIEADKFLFQDLKLVLASSHAMGGEGRDIGYLYISKDISHLI